MKKKISKKWKILGLVLVFTIFVSAFYLNNFYHADIESIEKFHLEKNINVTKDHEGNLAIGEENEKTGLIFYPGGKVEYTAYLPLMEQLASEGVFCVLVEMPFHLAVLDTDAADGIQEQYPTIERWYIGGHSLGGAMAASYVGKNTDLYEGLVLLGAYSTVDLSETDLQVLSIYGSEDQVMNREKYENNIGNLPSDFDEFVIDGGCHAYFGMYGFQEGDGMAEITNVEQIEKTANFIVKGFKYE